MKPVKGVNIKTYFYDLNKTKIRNDVFLLKRELSKTKSILMVH